MSEIPADWLAKQAAEADALLRRLSDNVGTVTFDAFDEASIATAIKQMEEALDTAVGHQRSNPFIGPIVVRLKESYRDGIRSTAQGVRQQKGH